MVDLYKYPEHVIHLIKTTAEERETVFKDYPNIKTEYQLFKYLEKIEDIPQKEIYKLAHLLDMLIFLMRQSVDERKQLPLKMNEGMRKLYDDSIKLVEKLKDNPLVKLELELTDKKITKLLSSYEQLRKGKSKRTGYNETVNFIMGQVFYILKDFGFGHNRQINFIYDAFVSFNIKGYEKGGYYKNDGTFISDIGQKDRIRPIQEKAMKDEGLQLLHKSGAYFKNRELEKPQ